MYNRYFITLKQQENIDRQKEHLAVGRCIIEINSTTYKISVSTQDLNSQHIYKIYTVYKKDFGSTRGIHIGNINTDEKGKGEFKKEFNIKEALEEQNDFEKVDAVFIVSAKKEVMLVGYKEESFLWDKKFLDEKIVSEESNILLQKKKIVKEDIKVASIFETKKSEKNNKKTEEKIIEKNIQTSQKEFEKTIEIEKTIVEKNTEIENIQVKNNIEQSVKYTKENFIKNNPPMIPFRKQNRKIKWVRINLEESSCLKKDYFKYVDSQFVLNAYKNYNHLIFGYANDKLGETYFLGIPEIYDNSFKNTAIKYGFTQFKCCDDIRIRDGVYGYWLVRII